MIILPYFVGVVATVIYTVNPCRTGVYLHKPGILGAHRRTWDSEATGAYTQNPDRVIKEYECQQETISQLRNEVQENKDVIGPQGYSLGGTLIEASSANV